MINFFLYRLHSNPEQLLWYDDHFYVPENAFNVIVNHYGIYKPEKLDKERAMTAIAKDPHYAYRYATEVLEKRWPEAEKHNQHSNNIWWKRYKFHFNIK